LLVGKHERERSVFGFFLWAWAGGGFFLPAIIARCRNHYNKGAILALNVFLGWKIIGWGLAMVWATMRAPAQPSAPAGKGYPECPDGNAKQYFAKSMRRLVQLHRRPEFFGRDIEYDIACMTALAVNNLEWMPDDEKAIVNSFSKEQFIVFNCATSTAVYFTWLWKLQYPAVA
jgi:hypothetical protein